MYDLGIDYVITQLINPMDDKKAIEILLNLLNKYPLNDEEKEAVRSSVGILSWTSLAQGRAKAIKKKRDKDIERWIR